MPSAPYPVLSTILDAARVRLNDFIVQGGETLTDTQPFTLPVANLAWQHMQQVLSGFGFYRLKDDVILFGLQPPATLDSAQQVYVDWTGYWDGSTLDYVRSLPQTMIKPLKVRERVAGVANVVNTAPFTEMDEIIDASLPSIPQQQWQGMWQWQADRIYMPGSTVVTDLWVTYAKYLPDFGAVSDTVPILRCEDCFANFIAYEMCAARGDVDGAAILANAKEGALILAGMDTSQLRSIGKTSEYGKMRDGFTQKGTQ
jgi:hypothetical protein